MKDHRIRIPKDVWHMVHFKQNDLPGIAMVNASLKQAGLHPIFRWHLSLVIEFADLIENGMPSRAERDIVEPFCDELEAIICGDKKKPDALFLARITWDATRELIWRVYDPEPANAILQNYMDRGLHSRHMNYKMEDDPKWALAQWHLHPSPSAK